MGSSAEDGLNEVVGEPVQLEGLLTEPYCRFIMPKTDYRLPLPFIPVEGGTERVLGMTLTQFWNTVIQLARGSGVPLTQGASERSIRLAHRLPVGRLVKSQYSNTIVEDTTVVVITNYHENWPALLKRMRDVFRPRRESIQVEILTPLAAAQFSYTSLSDTRLIRDWESTLLPVFRRLLSAVARVTKRPLLWNTISCLDMQRKISPDHAIGPRESIIEITVPVGQYDPRWDLTVVKQIRIILMEVNMEYESVPIYVIQRDTSPNAPLQIPTLSVRATWRRYLASSTWVKQLALCLSQTCMGPLVL